VLIGIARPLYAHDPMGVDLDQSLYALDSTTIQPNPTVAFIVILNGWKGG
jgi:hypothetical protein